MSDTIIEEGWNWLSPDVYPETKVALAVLGGLEKEVKPDLTMLAGMASEAFDMPEEHAMYEFGFGDVDERREAVVRRLRYLPVGRLHGVLDQIADLAGLSEESTRMHYQEAQGVLEELESLDLGDDLPHDATSRLGRMCRRATTNLRSHPDRWIRQRIIPPELDF